MKCIILLFFYRGSIIVCLTVVYEYNYSLVIIIDDNLIVNIKFIGKLIFPHNIKFIGKLIFHLGKGFALITLLSRRPGALLRRRPRAVVRHRRPGAVLCRRCPGPDFFYRSVRLISQSPFI
jgi:hypothetical protein